MQGKEAKRRSRPLPRPGRFGRVPGKLRAFGRSLGTGQTWLVSLTPPRGLVVSLAILKELTEELGLGLLVFGELLDGEDLLETLDVFLL